MRCLLLLALLACTRGDDDPVDTSSTDTHDHSTHSHTGAWPQDTSPVTDTGEWQWACTPEWEAGSDLVGAWEVEIAPGGRLFSLEDYTGCQALFLHQADGRVDAYIALLRANVVQDLSQRHGQPPQPTSLLSEPPDFTDADGDSVGGALARGGMAGAYLSRARNLVEDDPGGEHADAFLFDVRLGGQFEDTRRLAAELPEMPDGPVTDIALSGNGEWMVLASQAENLGEIAPGPGAQLFARRNVEGARETALLTVGADAACGEPQLSHDGRYVAFSADATTLVAGDTNGVQDVFVIDRDPDGNGVFEPASRATVRISAPAGGQADGPSHRPRLSADGRFVAFESTATNLVAGDANGVGDVFLVDRDADEDGVFDEIDATRLERVSVSTAGTEGDGPANHAGVSDDGRWVAFAADSTASPLVAGAPGQHVYIRDRATGTTALVTHDNAGSPALPGSMRPFVSRSGRTLVFVTASTTYDAEASASDLHLGFAENPIWAE